MATKPEDTSTKILEELLKTTYAITLGAVQKGVEMVSKPEEALTTLINHAHALTTVPPGTPNYLPDQAQALAGVWLEKGTTFVKECKAEGEKKK